MNFENPEEKAYLYELYTLTGGDTDMQVSMHDVGSALGLDKTEASSMAEGLFIQGFAELKTLSGGIGITHQGLEALDIKVIQKNDGALTLGMDIVLDEAGQRAMDLMLPELKTFISNAGQAWETLEEMVMDIKTIEVQMLSPGPKTQIIREILRSLYNNLKKSDSNELSARLEALLKS
jgi:hypothetical protein